MVRDADLRTGEATGRKSRKTQTEGTKGTEQLMNVRVVSKRGAGGDHQGHQVRCQRQNQTGDAGKVKPQRKSSSSPSSITP